MSRTISVLVYGDCPELQGCELDLDISTLELGHSKNSLKQKMHGFDLAVLVADGSGDAALRYVNYLQQVMPSCTIIVVAEPEAVGLVEQAIEAGATDYLLRAGAPESLTPLLTHTIERAMRHTYLKERFHESERRFWTFFDHCPIGLVIMNLSGQCEHANKAFTEMTGRPIEQLRTLSVDALVVGDDKEIWESLREELAGGERDFVRVEQQFEHEDGESRWARFASVAMCDPDGSPAYLLGMATDTTGRKRIQENLEHADKMQAMGRLAGGVAHDFNNLLTIVNSHCFIMRDSLDDPERIGWSVDRIMTATGRGSKLTRQLLTFGRHHTSDTEPVNPNDLLKKMRVVLESLFGKTVQVHLALGEELRNIDANRSELEQVIMNLALNARDAMGDSGQFNIRTYNMDVTVPSSAVPAELPHGQYTVIEVDDSGSGMTPEVQKQAFEPFFTTKDIGQGTGLGLSTVYGVVTQNNGHIDIDSEEGRGTTFTIYFPAARQDSKTPPKLRRARRGTPTNGSETILLVEDEGDLRKPLKQLLESKGYQVIDAADAEEALSVSRAHNGPIDLLLTDVIMPGIDGVSLADTISEERPETSVILMSGYTADVLSMDHDEKRRPRKMLQKPFGMDILSRTIRGVLETA